MTEAERAVCGQTGPYRVVYLSKVIDPTTERRRCELRRQTVEVQGVADYHTDVDIVTHLGTHVEAPYHHADLTKDVTAFPFDYYMGRGVLLHLDTCEPRALIAAGDLEAASSGIVQAGDTVLLTSRFHHEPFVVSDDDQRPQLSAEAARWFLSRRVRAVGFGDGVAIENNPDECIACHDILLGNDILFLEVLQNLDQLQSQTFMVIYLPLPIVGLDSSPVNMVAIEGIPGFS